MAASTGQWYNRGIPLIAGEGIAYGELDSSCVGATSLTSTLAGQMPGAAVWSTLTSKSSNNDWFIQLDLYDVRGVAMTRSNGVRVYLANTTDAAGAWPQASTAPGSLVVATTDYAVGANASTHLAAINCGFVTSATGGLVLRLVYTGAGASTYTMVADWAGGCYTSTKRYGSTTLTT